MISTPGEASTGGIDVHVADAILNVAATLNGVAEALSYRAAAENDDMLAMLECVLSEQSNALREVVR